MITRGDNRYFITFIDDSSRYAYVYLLKYKDKAFNVFKNYKVEVDIQLGKKLKILRSDKEGEYFSKDFNNFCGENYIIHNVQSFVYLNKTIQLK